MSLLPINEKQRICTKTIYAITKPGGQLILNDFHTFRKTGGDGDYFSAQLEERSVPCRWHFSEEQWDSFPKMMVRFYTLGEIINAVISSGFVLLEFAEHPGSFYDKNEKIPGEFTMVAKKRRLFIDFL